MDITFFTNLFQLDDRRKAPKSEHFVFPCGLINEDFPDNTSSSKMEKILLKDYSVDFIQQIRSQRMARKTFIYVQVF